MKAAMENLIYYFKTLLVFLVYSRNYFVQAIWFIRALVLGSIIQPPTPVSRYADVPSISAKLMQANWFTFFLIASVNT